MALYRDAVARFTIAQVRQAYPPRVYRTLTRVRLDYGGVVADVAIEKIDTPGCIAGARRWFRCPRCGGRVNVLGVVDGLGWVCRVCGGWRSRNRRRVDLIAVAE